MRFANLNGRAAVIAGDAAVDVAGASGGRFPADPQAVLAEWDAFRDWAAALDAARGEPFAVEDLGPPLPARPRCSRSASTTPSTRTRRGTRPSPRP